jgi:hypothetical protein
MPITEFAPVTMITLPFTLLPAWSAYVTDVVFVYTFILTGSPDLRLYCEFPACPRMSPARGAVQRAPCYALVALLWVRLAFCDFGLLLKVFRVLLEKFT